MDYTTIRISKVVAGKLKVLADSETERRGAPVNKSYLLNEILTEYFNKIETVNKEGFKFSEGDNNE